MTLSSGSTALTYPTATIVVAGGAVTTVTITSAGVGFRDTTTVLTAPAASIGGTGSGFTVPVATLATGGNNTAVGYQALNANTTASSNDAFGNQALFRNTTGRGNSAFGNLCLFNNTTGLGNVALGGGVPSAVFGSLYNNTTGNSNTSVGAGSLVTNTTASNNSAFGYATLSNSSGAGNTALGYQAGNAVTSGANNTLLGNVAGFSGTNNLTTGSNNIIIGYNAEASSATVSNEVTIGNTSVTSTRLRGAVTTTGLTGNIGVGRTLSNWAGLSYNVVEIMAAGNAIYSGVNDIWYTQNAYYNSGWKYGATAQAASYNQNAGVHNWRTAVSGSADAALTWNERMRIHVTGGVSIGNTTDPGAGNLSVTGNILSNGATGAIGYATGSGGAVTQATSRTTGVTLNKTNGAITLVSAAGLATYQSFTVTNSTVAATDTININQKSGTDKYIILVTNVAAGSFEITFATTGGLTTEQPVFNFAVIKAVTA
jgi:hypothetical protein